MTARERTVLSVRMDVTLRLAVTEDLPKLEWYGLYAHQRAVFRRVFHEQEEGRRLMLVADCNDFPVGHVFVQLSGGEPSVADGVSRAYLYAFRVMEMFRNRGIGTRLLLEAERLLVERGFEWSTIAVARTNEAAKRLYERLGYHIFSDDPGVWNERDPYGSRRWVLEPAWLLAKNLDSHLR